MKEKSTSLNSVYPFCIIFFKIRFLVKFWLVEGLGDGGFGLLVWGFL